MLVKCLYCNKEFNAQTYENTNKRRDFFCCQDCLDSWNNEQNTKQTICKVCGQLFKQLRKMDGTYEEKTICSNCINKVQCQYCGKYYIPERKSNGRRKTYYCSQECCDKWNLEINTRRRNCKFCGKEFIVLRQIDGFYSESVYCSDACVKAQCEIDTQKISKCKFCGKEFTQKKRQFINDNGYICYENERKTYCSDECYKRACQFSYNYQPKRICACCGKEFIADKYTEDDEIIKREPRLLGLYKKANTCSYECRRKLRSQRYKQTCLDKYGVTSCAKLDSSKEKSKQTCLDRYGVTCGLLTEKAINANLNNKSQINLKFGELLNNLGLIFESEFVIEHYSYDFYLPGQNTIIELNPTFTHTSIETQAYKGKDKNYHLDKTTFANEHGYRCINIWEWDNDFKVALSCKSKQKRYARKLQLKEISKQDANEFLNEYHLQNSCYGNTVNLGLYQNDELIQVMTFGKPRYNKNYQWELLRLCTKSEYYVVGGAERLFKYFIKTQNPESVISYCDISKFTGDVYERLGFSLLRQSLPQKIWSKSNSKEYITDNLLRQRGFDQLVGLKLNPPEIYGKGTDNEELMLSHYWLPVYDCGQKTFVWQKI